MCLLSSARKRRNKTLIILRQCINYGTVQYIGNTLNPFFALIRIVIGSSRNDSTMNIRYHRGTGPTLDGASDTQIQVFT